MVTQPLRPVPTFLPAFMAKAEAKRNVAYWDAQGRVWTIGIGHTGPEVIEGMTITDEMVMLYLRQDLAIAARRLASVVDSARIMAMSENQYAAALSFVFNLGVNGSWTIWKVMNKGDFAQVPAQMDRFDMAHDAKGVAYVVPGLKHRREAEEAMWNTPDPADKANLANIPPLAAAIVANAPVDLPSSGGLRETVTPPQPSPAAPHGIAALWGSAVAAILAAPQAIKGMVDFLSPYSSTDIGGKVIAGLMTVAMGAAALSYVYQLRQHHELKN